MTGNLRTIALLLLLALLTAACWWGWMGWDDEYQIDPKTGYATGPYEAWQVIGCVLCLLAIGVIAALLLPALAVVATMTVAFTIAWTQTAMATDDTGLSGVGAVMVFIGMAAATGVVVPVVQAVAGRRRA